MKSIAYNDLITVSASSNLSDLVRVEVKSFLDFGLMEQRTKTRIINSLRRNMYSGVTGPNVEVFEILCGMHEIPYVLKGMHSGYFPVKTRALGEEFMQDAVAAYSLVKDLERQRTYNAEYTPARWASYGAQLQRFPIVEIDVPDSRWDVILNVYDKHWPPRNQTGINNAVATLKNNAVLEYAVKATEAYKGGSLWRS